MEVTVNLTDLALTALNLGLAGLGAWVLLDLVFGMFYKGT